MLVLRVDDLRAQVREVNADLREVQGIDPVRVVRLNLLYNDTGWRELPALFTRMFRLLRGVVALHVEDALVVRFSNPVTADARGDYVARALGQVERPARVAELSLRESMMTDAGFERLEPFVAGIASLDVSGNELQDVAARLLASWGKDTASLERLRLDDNTLTSRGVQALASDADLPKLSELGLAKCGLGAASVRRLVDGGLDAVTDLSLSDNPLGDEGAGLLAEGEWCSRLERLALARCGIGDAGVREIARSPSLRSIGVLDLRENEFTDRGRKALHDRFGARVLTDAFGAAP